MAYLTNDEQGIAYVQGYVAADLRVEDNVAHCSLPDPVEVQTYQFAVRIDDRTAGVASRGVVVRQEAHRA